MKQTPMALVVGAAALALAAGTAAAKPGAHVPPVHGGGGAKGRPQRAVADLAIPNGGADADARGRVDVKHFPKAGKRAERSWFRLKLGRLDGTDYTVWMDDPSTPETDLVQLAAVTADADGHARLGFDTKHGDALPFSATLTDLGGKALEVRDASNVTVLAGTVPVLK